MDKINSKDIFEMLRAWYEYGLLTRREYDYWYMNEFAKRIFI